MYSRFKEELDQFLKPYHIDSDTGIFEDVLAQMAELSPAAKLNIVSDDSEVRVLIQGTLTDDDRIRLLQTLDAHPTSYAIEHPIYFNAKPLLTLFIPAFKKVIIQWAELTPECLAPYITNSQPKFVRHAESVKAVEKLKQEIEVFLARFSISMSTSDVIEHTVLYLMELKKPDSCMIHFHDEDGKGRVQFRFEDMSTADAKKAVHYFKTAGDDTAHQLLLYVTGSGVMPEAGSKEEDYRRIEVHGLDVDALTFYNKIYPAIKDQIVTWSQSAPEKLLDYQEKSYHLFRNKPTANHHCLFLAPKPIEVVHEKEEYTLSFLPNAKKASP